MSKLEKSKFRPDSIQRINSLKDMTLASFLQRLIAFYIDIFIVVIILIAIEIPVIIKETAHSTVNHHYEINPFHGWSIIVLVLYSGLLTYFLKGQTLGKKIMKIKVISLTHEHISLWHSIERALGYGASALEAGFGFVQFFIHPNRQTVHDRIAETIVISLKKDKKITC
ncbi:MAG: RDD family protein [Ignavibacteriaceae bacterium]